MNHIPVGHFNLVIKRNLPSLPLINVFFSPKEYKGEYVARLFYEDVPTPYIAVKHDLDSIRKVIPSDLVRFHGTIEDEEHLVESWV